MESRFGRQGKLPGVLLLVSSNLYPDDFTIWRRELAESKGQRIFHRRYSQWETKPKSFYLPERFLLSLGNSVTRPRIIRDVEHELYDGNLDNIETLKKKRTLKY